MMEQNGKLKSFGELGGDVIISSRSLKLYPVYQYQTSGTIKNHLLFLSLYGKIDAAFPHYYELKEADSWLMIYTISGSGMLTAEENSAVLAENTVLFFHCGQAHSIGLHDAKEWKYIVLHINGGELPFYYELFMSASASKQQTSAIKTATSLDDHLLLATPASKIPSIFKRLESLAEGAGDELYSSDSTGPAGGAAIRPLMISLLLTELLTELIVEKNAFYTKCLEIPSYLYALKKDLDESYPEPWKLALMEERYQVSKFSIVHDFTKYFGISPVGYLIRRRIGAAKDLLGSTELAVNRVAAAVGIDNINHFIYLFKKEAGMTPSAWRKNARMHES
ncbi:MAG: AraC family transcriptional regulator [Lachnospiraceae bacterium]